VSYSVTVGTFTQSVAAGATSAVFSGLTSGQNYSVTVSAVFSDQSLPPVAGTDVIAP
jgi:hypothetical protein